MSIVRLSHPACAITSAEKELGTCNQPFTAVSPSRQIFFRRFSLTLDLLPQRHTYASCNSVDVVASPSTSQVAPVPCPTPPSSSLRGYQGIGEVFIATGGFGDKDPATVAIRTPSRSPTQVPLRAGLL